MADFRFISDDVLRNMLERDKQELEKSVQNHLYKSAMILAGSIIEAVLVDYFLTFPRSNTTNDQILNANLNNLIEWARHDDLISQRTKDMSAVIRNYRNLIHPGREYRLKENIDIHNTTVANSLVEIIVQEISENYGARLGYRADQAIAKARVDPSFSSFLRHIVDNMVSSERIKLFLLIPRTANHREDIPLSVQNLVKLHDSLKRNVSREILLQELKFVYDQLQNRTQIEALFLLQFFTTEVTNLADHQKNALVSYMLDILATAKNDELQIYDQWISFRCVGLLLNNEEGRKQIRNLLTSRLVRDGSSGDDYFISIFANQVLWTADYRFTQTLVSVLRSYYNHYFHAEFWAEYIDSSTFPF